MEKFRKILIVSIVMLVGTIVLVVALATPHKPDKPMTGVIQSVSTDGKVKNTYYGDYEDGWNKSVDLGLNPSQWKLKVERHGKYQELLQYFHPDESPQHWTEFVTVERLVGPIVPTVTPDGIEMAVRSRTKLVRIYQPDRVFYMGYSENNTRLDLVWVFIKKDVVFTLTYATHNLTDDANNDKWVEILKNARVS